MTQKAIYMDYAAATPVDSSVLKAMEPYFAQKFYNPSALYMVAKAVAGDVTVARKQIAKWLGARPAEIIFTAGGTEANNLAIQGVMQRYPDAKVIVSAMEHESVLQPAYRYNCQEAPVQADGQIDLVKLLKLIDGRTVLVSVMYANNEIGTIEPLARVAVLLKEIRQKRARQGNHLPLYFHTDACQAANYLHLYVDRLGVDMLTINGGKIYGPKQSGALYVRTGVELAPQILGGGQEHGLRSGTEHVAGIVGLAKALDLVQADRHDEARRLLSLQKLFVSLLKEKLPQAQINGGKHRLPNNIHITIPGQDNERLVLLLDEADVLCASGSACSASNDEPSHVLRAIGFSDAQARASLRFTMGRQTNEAAVHRAVEGLYLACQA